ncbi:MAG: hypothetical protein K2W96_00165, partial [Gemmataceae bacterium]|nr:hypothetical protein [Gemmataceae bacterium]
MHELHIAPSGRLVLAESAAGAALPAPLVAAFAESPSHGLLHLATRDLHSRLPAPLEFARSFATDYLARLCRAQGHEASAELPAIPSPTQEEFAAR